MMDLQARGGVVCLQTISSGAGLIGTVIEAGGGAAGDRIFRMARFRAFGFGGGGSSWLCGWMDSQRCTVNGGRWLYVGWQRIKGGWEMLMWKAGIRY